MKLKIDENLPAECAILLRDTGHEADTVTDERLLGAEDDLIASRSKAEGRVLVALDLDFGNVQAYLGFGQERPILSESREPPCPNSCAGPSNSGLATRSPDSLPDPVESQCDRK